MVKSLFVIQMPKKIARCSACDGTGHPLEMGEETCPSCAGIGRDKRSDIMCDHCLQCNGRGRVPYCRRSIRRYCHVCNGSGIMEF